MQVGWKQSESFLARARNAAHATQEEWGKYLWQENPINEKKREKKEGITPARVCQYERDPRLISLGYLMAWFEGTNDEGKAIIRRYLAEQFEI